MKAIDQECVHSNPSQAVVRYAVPNAEHGFKPKLEETERSSPELYDKFVRYVALQDYVRNFEAQL